MTKPFNNMQCKPTTVWYQIEEARTYAGVQ
jgi:hypothetical protein